jgi:hypothetical protein
MNAHYKRYLAGIGDIQINGIISDLFRHAEEWKGDVFTDNHGECLIELAEILIKRLENNKNEQ